MLYTKALQLIGVAGMGSMMAIVPVLAVISALFVFNETLKSTLFIGMVLVSFGVWLPNTQRFKATTIKKA